MTTRLLLLRHGSTDWNRDKRMQGRSDIELNEDGLRQAKAAAARLQAVKLTAVYSSDLRRALVTADLIARAHDLETVVDPALRELDEGEWEGLTADEIAGRWPELWQNRSSERRPGGESPADALSRAVAGLGRIVRAHPEGSVVVVTSQGVIRLLEGVARGYDVLQTAAIRGLAPGEIVVLEGRLDDGLQLAPSSLPESR